MTEKCPCGSEKKFSDCCGPYLTGKAVAPTAETLMRSRYTAFVKVDVPYLKATLHPSERHDFNEEVTQAWASKSNWLGLDIIATQDGGPKDKDGTVEFVARYQVEGVDQRHHEVGKFVKEDGNWYFFDGKVKGPPPVVRETPKIGRNDPCACGSGKKYKKCCGAQ